MNTVAFDTVWKNVLALLEKPSGTTLTEPRERQILVWFNQRVRRGWMYGQWPELMLSEQRAFRAHYRDTKSYLGGDEVYDPVTDAYYVALQASTGAALTDATKWQAVTDLDPYLLWAQEDLWPLWYVEWVSDNDPERYADRRKSREFLKTRKGLQVLGSVIPTKVWVRHRARPNNVFTRTAFDPANPPSLGGIAYRDADGECYQAVIRNGANAWNKIDFPAFLQSYVELGVLADDLRADGQKERAEYYEAKAREELEREWQAQTE
jgi:hypothetical protein